MRIPQKVKKLAYALFIVLLAYTAPQFILYFVYAGFNFDSIDGPKNTTTAIVFGARVYEDGELSPVLKERMDAAIILYENKKVRQLFLSGDNRANTEVEAMAAYAINQGVERSDIITDFYGIDTNDTCRHAVEQDVIESILVTQSFHLPRAMFMCDNFSFAVEGLRVEKLGLLEERGDNMVQIYAIRTKRFFREAGLSWLYLLQIYDLVSNEAEELGY